MSATLDLTPPDEEVLGAAPLVQHPLPAPVPPEKRAPALAARKTLLLVAAVSLLWPLMTAWEQIVAAPSIGLAATGLTGGALVLIVLVATAQSVESLRRLEVWVLVLAALVVLAETAAILQVSSSYLSDEAAFQQGAAQLLLHGHDPYGRDLASSLFAFRVPGLYTFTLGGGTVTTYSYPALPLLLVAPFVALTGGGQAVPILYVLLLVLGMAGSFKLLPERLRLLAVVVFAGLPPLFNLALDGMSEIMAVVALIPVAYSWTRVGGDGFATRTAVRRWWWSAAALGLALSTNQLAWFIAPFLLVGIYLIRAGAAGAREGARTVVGYAGGAALAFLVINLPFIAWSPGNWLSAVASPVTQHAVPYGQGLISLPLFAGIGGGDLFPVEVAAAAAFLGLLAIYALHFRRLGRACFVLPLIVLFVSGRSLGAYWFAPIPLLLLALATDRPTAFDRAAELLSRVRRSRPRLALSASALVPAVLVLGVAFTIRAPLTIHVLTTTASSTTDQIYKLRMRVTNTSSHRLRPHFSTDSTGRSTSFWRVRQGPRVLLPHSTSTYVITAVDMYGTQPADTPFVVQAFTDSPETVSTSTSHTGADTLTK